MDYVELRDGGYYVTGTRVSLDSVAYAFLRGESAEGIAESFPALSLEQIFGALSYYLANQELIDRHLGEGKKEFERLRQQARKKNRGLYAKLTEARQKTHSPRA